jgi:hypothetical protein
MHFLKIPCMKKIFLLPFPHYTLSRTWSKGNGSGVKGKEEGKMKV